MHIEFSAAAVAMMSLGGKMGVERSFVVWKCFVLRQCSTPRATQMARILTQFQYTNACTSIHMNKYVYINTDAQIHFYTDSNGFHTDPDGYLSSNQKYSDFDVKCTL